MRHELQPQQDAQPDFQPLAILVLLGSICLLVVVAASGALAPLPPLHVVSGPGPLAVRAVIELPRLALAGPPSAVQEPDVASTPAPASSSSRRTAEGTSGPSAAVALAVAPLPPVPPATPLPSDVPTTPGLIPVGSGTPTPSVEPPSVVDPTPDETRTPAGTGGLKPAKGKKGSPPGLSKRRSDPKPVVKPSPRGSSAKHRSSGTTAKKSGKAKPAAGKPSGKGDSGSKSSGGGKTGGSRGQGKGSSR